MHSSEIFHKVIPSPPKPNNLPVNIHWLSGEGCGSWFHIEQLDDNFVIIRYSPDGKLECKGLFEQTDGVQLNMDKHFEFTYLSHCAVVNIIQQTANLRFKLKNKLQ